MAWFCPLPAPKPSSTHPGLAVAFFFSPNLKSRLRYMLFRLEIFLGQALINCSYGAMQKWPFSLLSGLGQPLINCSYGAMSKRPAWLEM